MQYDGRRPLCIGTGMVVLDVIYGSGRSASPQFFAGGSCGNVLTILSHFGWDSMPAAVVGDDPEGRRLIRDIARWGVGTDFLRVDSRSHTPRIIERIRPDREPHHRFEMTCSHGKRLPRRRAYPKVHAHTIARSTPAATVFYFDRANGAALEIALSLKAMGTTVVFEPHRLGRDGIFARCLAASDIVKYCGSGAAGGERIAPDAALEIRTAGSAGLAYWLGPEGRGVGGGAGGMRRLAAIPARQVVDEAGSGDWLTAGLLDSLFWERHGTRMPARAGVERALRFGQALASLNCSHVGARGLMYAVPRGRLVSSARRAAGLAAAAPSRDPRRSLRGRGGRAGDAPSPGLDAGTDTGRNPPSARTAAACPAGAAPECSACACGTA